LSHAARGGTRGHENGAAVLRGDMLLDARSQQGFSREPALRRGAV